MRIDDIDVKAVDFPIRALHDNVFIERIDKTATTGKIVLPDVVKANRVTGKVLAVGPGKLIEGGDYRETTVKVGDYVCFIEFSALDLKIRGKNWYAIREYDILGVIDKDKIDDVTAV